MKIKYVVFDMDGTILNTIDDLCDSVNYMLDICGYPQKTLEQVKSYVGNGIVKLVERVLPSDINKDDFEKSMGIFKAHYEVNKNNKTAPYKGIIETMSKLKDMGIVMSVVSNKYDAGVKALAQDVFPNMLPVAIGESQLIKPKPCSDGVELALKMMGASHSNAVYVGDSEVDFETAKNSNLPFVGVSWGFRTRELLEGIGAKHIIDEPIELIEELGKINE